METLSKSEKRSIFTVHELEVALVEFREKKYARAFKRGFKAVSSPKSFLMMLKVVNKRKKEYQLVQQ